MLILVGAKGFITEWLGNMDPTKSNRCPSYRPSQNLSFVHTDFKTPRGEKYAAAFFKFI